MQLTERQLTGIKVRKPGTTQVQPSPVIVTLRLSVAIKDPVSFFLHVTDGTGFLGLTPVGQLITRVSDLPVSLLGMPDSRV